MTVLANIGTAAIILVVVAAFGWWVEWRMGRKKVGTDDE